MMLGLKGLQVAKRSRPTVETNTQMFQSFLKKSHTTNKKSTKMKKKKYT